MLASLKPIRLMMLDDASDRLLKASAVMEIEPEIKPAASLNTNIITLQIMPTMPESLPYAVLTSTESVEV